MLVTKDHKNVQVDDELDLFDEDDWDFLSAESEMQQNYTYFSGENEEFLDTKGAGYVMRCVVMSLIPCILVFALGMSVYNRYVTSKLSTDADVMSATEEASGVGVIRVSGEEVSSDVWLPITDTLNKYFSTLYSGDNLENLSNYCVSSSNFADTEESHRRSAKYVYDDSDCYARALREFGTFIKLQRVVDIIKKGDSYYCYMSLQVPSVNDLYEYFMLYSFEMTKYFQNNALTSINVTKYMLQTTGNNDVPTKEAEYVFEVQQTGRGYVIVDDSEMVYICQQAYASCVDNITNILGSHIISTFYE